MLEKISESVEEKVGAPRRIPLPPGATECFANVPGSRLRYLRAGSGPPLVLLHGMLGYSFSWRFNLVELAKHRTVYAIDQLGAGFSDRPLTLDCSMRAVAERTLAFVEQEIDGPFDLLGTSHGGAIAVFVAAMLAQRGKSPLQRLILVAPANPWSEHGRVLAPFVAQPPVSAAFRWTVPRVRFAWGFALRRIYGDPKKIAPGTLEGYAAPFDLPGSLEYGLGILDTWLQDLEEMKALLPTLVDMPTCLIWGSADPAVLPESAEPLRQNFRNCEYVTLPGVGHLPYEEAPEDFNRAVVEFLKK